MNTGIPAGIKKPRKRIPCLMKPIVVTPTKTTAAMAKVTMMWLV